MSASLVGSEMCIRDRRTCAARLAPIGTGARARKLWLAPPPAAPGLPLPVSYTHLTLPTICSV
eukprot:8039679-Alexandrium_andersonii.AAC.1